MAFTFAQYQESADYIKEKIGGFIPKVAMVFPGLPVGAHAPGGVGDDEGVAAQQPQDADGVGHLVVAVALVMVHPALHDRRRAAAELSIPLREGVYFYCYGPQYETPAEIRAVRALGGDAVGMSTAPEAIVAGHCGMEVLGFTLLSNMAAGGRCTGGRRRGSARRTRGGWPPGGGTRRTS